MVDEQKIDDHLRQALSHIVSAINSSITAGVENPSGQKVDWAEVGILFRSILRVC